MPAISGRPDGRLSKYIYADGQGGVCRDMRYSANGLTPTDFADADQRVKNGTYRGFEKVVFMKLATFTQESAYYGSFIYDDGSGAVVCSSLWIPFTNTGTQALASNPYCRPLGICSTRNGRIYSSSGTTASGMLLGNGPSSVDGFSNGDKILVPFFTTSSVGGSFLQTDVIGNPENILATPALANGWQGSWIPVIPDGTSKTFTSTRKLVSSNYINRVYTNNNGVSYVNGTAHANFSAILNGYTFNEPTTLVNILQYQAFAKQTENAVNAVVYGWINGIGQLFSECYYQKEFGSLLQESLIGKVNISDSTQQGDLSTHYLLTSININASDSKINNIASRATKHSSLGVVSPSNNSPAIKALNYNVNLNQQAFIQYAYTELKHNGTNWGDDGKVTIVDNQSTKTDLNGNTVLVGTAQTCESLGWIKNKL